mmetsp:Transcript_25155/g.70119  ORF Transcript_25155/g.70119 Transcript_25155/m.70119 type:complete len:244 (+) Transcript_25155:1069-1800(+)
MHDSICPHSQYRTFTGGLELLGLVSCRSRDINEVPSVPWIRREAEDNGVLRAVALSCSEVPGAHVRVNEIVCKQRARHTHPFPMAKREGLMHRILAARSLDHREDYQLEAAPLAPADKRVSACVASADLQAEGDLQSRQLQAALDRLFLKNQVELGATAKHAEYQPRLPDKKRCFGQEMVVHPIDQQLLDLSDGGLGGDLDIEAGTQARNAELHHNTPSALTRQAFGRYPYQLAEARLLLQAW